MARFGSFRRPIRKARDEVKKAEKQGGQEEIRHSRNYLNDISWLRSTKFGKAVRIVTGAPRKATRPLRKRLKRKK